MKNPLLYASLLMLHASCFTLHSAPLPEPQAQATAEQSLAWSAALAPSCVKVSYVLQFAEGDKPSGVDFEELLIMRRNLELPGWLVAPDTVLVLGAPDLEPQFVKEIRVLHKDAAVTATESRYALDRTALTLTLDAPLPETAPLVFDGDAAKESFLAAYDNADGSWHTAFRPYSRTLVVSDVDGPFYDESQGLVLDDAGRAVRLAAKARVAPERIGENHTHWRTVPVDEFRARQDDIADTFGGAITVATIHFRSPKRSGADSDYRSYSYYGGSNDDFIGDPKATVQYAIALHYAPGKFLVLKSFDNDMTARMDKVLLTTTAGEDARPPVAATFVASLAEYGAFIVETDDYPSPPVPVSPEPITAYRNALLHNVKLTAAGETLNAQFRRQRIASFAVGYAAEVFPRGADETFNFDADGRLVFFPILRRASGNDRGYRSRDRLPYPAARFLEKLQTLDGDLIDLANVPLSEADENRIAWLGAETQELTAELALAHKATKLYQDNNRSAALVTSVYAGSPAEKIGLLPGDILLRLHKPGEQAPIKISMERDYGYMREFPWEHYDQIPPEYFERLPSPWPKINDTLSKALTQIGIGKTAAIEWARDGQLRRADLAIEQSPPYYDSAPKVESETTGLTVCDATFEVRQFLGREPDDPGIVVVAVKAGSPAAISGIKPYELITHIDDTPLAAAADLDALLADKAAARLTVRRLNRDRIVSLAIAKDGI
ncbi:MAG: PDZ domain-containing protein [Kiritimatiellaeota bacterium]|nr:PDZ domain-containing protein [Kiritimatiellota bacterium]